MSPSLDSAEAQWQTQLAAMRAALVELKLPPKATNGETTSYVSDIDFDEDDDFTSGNSGDDVWDFISDSEDDLYSSDADEDMWQQFRAELVSEGFSGDVLQKNKVRCPSCSSVLNLS